MFENTVVDKLSELDLSPETEVTLTYSDGCDCFIHNESEVETALSETDTVSTFADLVSQKGLNFTDNWGNSVIDCLVDSDLIEEDFVTSCWTESEDDLSEETYDDYDLAEAITEAINNNFWDQEVIDKEVEAYDHKRGYITLSTTVVTTLGAVLEHRPLLTGWEVSVPTNGGYFTING